MIQTHATGDSIERGRAYFQAGAVRSLRRAGPDVVEAYVRGGAPTPYTVRLRHDERGLVEARCTCPYHAGAWCKHIVAVALACLHERGAEPVMARLEALDRAALVQLVGRLVEDDPLLAERVKAEAERLLRGD
ncbi:SWIM zinc finger family protein [Rhodocaloribacter litoris]|uniref:SWIM zinc finger family protein n=1 Tax=Rhodocaloribacter litoris TaxID=2558931 RepID=UPI0014231758|nr:SWIM zinc finger family protein [Rhodocaloribacter litoris]QXD16140.1 SWIM zinc finger family protein [Rhodocaloribacter litoris]